MLRRLPEKELVYPYFTGEGGEAQRGTAACPRSRSYPVLAGTFTMLGVLHALFSEAAPTMVPLNAKAGQRESVWVQGWRPAQVEIKRTVKPRLEFHCTRY